MNTLSAIRGACLVTLGGAALTACSSMNSVPTIDTVLLDRTGQNGRACIDASDINGFGVLEKDVISIDARQKYYLATVMPGCNDLALSPRALFHERFGEVCGGGMDSMRTGGDKCTLKHIYEFDDRSAAFAAHEEAIKRQKALRDAEQ
ncbi:DUF6491 family protein [Gilvimarinus algae]|uniref:DUF6491 family protein n=1 Tax=Gilvimarinus algae TaxID=3058037 RepID=A0ABT8TG89_9GAMM|nr:DUF6491 family protein [Gilvimarinus sp. SDUM040014]MDO3383101.1 DUF6491 family protein [Gilvimarinus sp. SDUM040014]